MATKSMAFCEVGSLIVVVEPSRPPTDQDWDALLQLLRQKLAQGCAGALVVTAGGGPDAKQRKAARGILGDTPLPVAVVSDAAGVRGIVTAFSWFNPLFRTFGHDGGAGVQEALKYLRVEAGLAARVLLKVTAMQREIGAT